jgi:tetratricopeptide (TPR) repeat protein
MYKLSAVFFLVLFILSSGSFSQSANSAASIAERGIKRQVAGDLDGAIADFTLAIGLTSRFENEKRPASTLQTSYLQEGAATVEIVNPGTAQLYVDRGVSYLSKHSLDEAVSDFDHAIRIWPALATAYVGRGFAMIDKGYYSKAIDDFDRAAKLDVKLAMAYTGRAIAKQESGDTRGAFVDYDMAIMLEPKNAEHYYHRGDAYRLAGDRGKALTDLDRAIELDPNRALSYLGRAALRSDNREFAAALPDLAHAIQLDPHQPVSYRVRGSVYLALGKPDLAENDFREALRLAPAMASEITAAKNRIKGIR